MAIFNNLSVVIPVGPNDDAWHKLLSQLAEFGKELEIILATCRPRPDNFQLPDNAQWISVPQGRALQLNAGASQISRDMIWFLHADTRLTEGITTVIRHYIEEGASSLGYFRLKFADDGPRQTRLNAWAANIRSRFFGLPFGDQGFIVNKTVFDQMEGFDEFVKLGEDLDFVVRLQAAGFPMQELPAVLITSARRYRHHGWFSTTIRHVCLTWNLTRQAKRRLVLS